ncbi:MAG: hypothetical protein AAGI66_02795 [Cyanobacteria bacterium P01_H01_bin.74]
MFDDTASQRKKDPKKAADMDIDEILLTGPTNSINPLTPSSQAAIQTLSTQDKMVYLTHRFNLFFYKKPWQSILGVALISSSCLLCGYFTIFLMGVWATYVYNTEA